MTFPGTYLPPFLPGLILCFVTKAVKVHPGISQCAGINPLRACLVFLKANLWPSVVVTLLVDSAAEAAALAVPAVEAVPSAAASAAVVLAAVVLLPAPSLRAGSSEPVH